MIRKLGLVILAVIVMVPGFSQVKTFSFDYLGFETPTCNPFKDTPIRFLDQWKVSHGTPASGDVYGQKTYDVGKLVGSYLGGTKEKSEGLFIAYGFVKSHLYDISITVAHDAGDPVGMDVYGAKNIEEKTNTSCLEEYIPEVSDKKIIYQTQDVYNGAIGLFKTYEIDNWSPGIDFSQLWVLSRQYAYSKSGSFFIYEIRIQDSGVDRTPPSAPANLAASSITASSFKVTWNAASDNGTLTGYNVYVDGVFRANTTLPSYNFSNMLSCNTFDISIRAYDAANNLSNPVSLKVSTLSGYNDEMIYNTDYSNTAGQLNFRAASNIYFRPGFYYTPPEGGNLSALIISCTIGSGGRMAFGADTTNVVEPIAGNAYRSYESVLERDTMDQVYIFPNPFKEEIKVNVSSDSYYDVVIRRIDGEKIYSVERQLNMTSLTLPALPSGIYLIEVTTSEQRTVKRIVKF